MSKSGASARHRPSTSIWNARARTAAPHGRQRRMQMERPDPIQTTETEVENAVARAIALHQVRSVKVVGEVDWVPWLPIARVAIAAYKGTASGK